MIHEVQMKYYVATRVRTAFLPRIGLDLRIFHSWSKDDLIHTKISHLESEPLFLSTDDPETEGLLRVGPRQDEFMNLLHHPLSLSYLSRRYFSRSYSSYPAEGRRNERVSEKNV